MRKRRRRELSRGSGGMLRQKISKSRRSEISFLALSWWYFPPQIIKSQLTLTAFIFVISSFLKIKFPVSFVSAFVTKNISISFKYTSSSVLVLRCTLYLRPPFYLEKAKAILLWPPVSHFCNICNGSGVAS